MNAPTPGPWITQDRPGCVSCIHDARGGHVATAHRPQVDTHDEAVRAANARLIAAAPELLEALRGLVGVFRDGNARFEDFDRAADEANRVIAKVEGGS